MPYTFLFINISGDFLSLAMRVKAEGNPIFYYKQKGMEKGRVDTGIGIFKKEEIVDDYWEVINQVPKEKLIILIDDNGYGDMADFLRNNGYMVIGGSSFADRIEYERGLGTKIMRGLGLAMPPEHKFTDFEEALSYLDSQEDDYKCVFKPDGEEFAGSAKTYTGKNKQDMVDYIKWIKEDCTTKHYTMNKFLLQDFIEGIEADFSAYFNGEKFMENLSLIDIEEKKTGDGNKGEASGCMGNIIINFGENKYYTSYLKKLEPMLRKAKYVGCISINNIFATKDGKPYGLEFTPRFGWDAHLTEAAILKKAGLKLSDFYIALVTKKPFSFPLGSVGCGVRVYTGSVSLKKDEVAGRYFSFDKSQIKNLWFYAVSLKDGSFLVEDNPVLLVQFVAGKLPQAIQGCYDLIMPKLNMPDIYYRMEIGKRAPEVIKFLKKFGWI